MGRPRIKPLEHTHRYKIAYIGKRLSYKIYACDLPGCFHYQHPDRAPKMLKTLCPVCQREYYIEKSKLDILEYTPKCGNCWEGLEPIDKLIVELEKEDANGRKDG